MDSLKEVTSCSQAGNRTPVSRVTGGILTNESGTKRPIRPLPNMTLSP